MDRPYFRSRLYETVKGWTEQSFAEGMKRGIAEGMAEGEAQGMEQGQRTLLVRMATTRFGTEAANQLATALTAAPPAALVAAGDGILACATAEELLARVESVAGAPPNSAG